MEERVLVCGLGGCQWMSDVFLLVSFVRRCSNDWMHASRSSLFFLMRSSIVAATVHMVGVSLVSRMV